MLIEKLAISRAEGGFLKFRDKLTKVDLLILDDLGIKRLPPSAVQDLYDNMEERHQGKSTVITTQLPVENWKEVIEDPVALEAIIDRIIHGSISINLKGESYRKTRANSLPTWQPSCTSGNYPFSSSVSPTPIGSKPASRLVHDARKLGGTFRGNSARSFKNCFKNKILRFFMSIFMTFLWLSALVAGGCVKKTEIAKVEPSVFYGQWTSECKPESPSVSTRYVNTISAESWMFIRNQFNSNDCSGPSVLKMRVESTLMFESEGVQAMSKNYKQVIGKT